MKKNRCIDIYERRFKGVNFKKIIPFRNPSDGFHFQLERINPNHKGIIWGRCKRTGNINKFAKVYFSSIHLVYGLSVLALFDGLTMYAYNLLLQITFYGLCVGIFYSVVVNLPLCIASYRRSKLCLNIF